MQQPKHMLPISLITNVGSTVYIGKLWTNCSRLKQYQESRSGCWNCFPKDHSVTYLKVVDMKFACIRFHSWRVYGLKVTHQMVYIWDTTSRHILYKLLGHIGSVNECVFHPSEPNVGACN